MKSTICKDRLHFGHLIYLSYHYLFQLYYFFAYSSILFFFVYWHSGFWDRFFIISYDFFFIFYFFLNEQQMCFRKALFSRLFCWLPPCTQRERKTTQKGCLVQQSIEGQERCTESWLWPDFSLHQQAAVDKYNYRMSCAVILGDKRV